MYFKNLTILTVLSTGIFLNIPKASAEDICTNSLKIICTDTKAERTENEKYTKFLKEEIRLEAQAPAIERIKKMEKEIPKYRFLKRFLQRMKIENQEIMKAAKVRMPSIERAINNPENRALIMQYFHRAIAKSSFDSNTQKIIQATVDSVRILNFEDYLNQLELEDNLLSQLVGNPCGSDGLVSNAFAATIKNTKSVVICPGYMIDSSINGADDKKQFQVILQVIGHEIGHHVDAHALGPKTYNNYLTCINNNYGNTFKKSKSDAKFCKNKKTSAIDCQKQVTLSHSGELVADVWGMKVINEYALDNQLSYDESSRLLTNSFKNLCDTKDGGAHPAGDFRIGTHILLQPEMNSLFSCQNNNEESQKKELCSF